MSDEDNKPPRDKVIADSGWGVKPDDQPANVDEGPATAGNRYVYDAADPEAVSRILRAQRQGFNTARRVIVEAGRTSIVDINKDRFVVEGLGFGDENLIELLRALGAAFDPQKLRQLGPDFTGLREYSLSRTWAWGAERPS